MQNIPVLEIAKRYLQKLKVPDKKSSKPFLLMLGGLQGSGKTSVLEKLQENTTFVVVSLDEIRHIMLEMGLVIDDDFRKAVNNIAFDIVKELMAQNVSVAIDTNANEQRITAIRSALDSHVHYKLCTVLLDVSIDELRQRVLSRKPRTNSYTGTASELEGSYKTYKDRDHTMFDHVISWDGESVEEMAEVIERLLSS